MTSPKGLESPRCPSCPHFTSIVHQNCIDIYFTRLTRKYIDIIFYFDLEILANQGIHFYYNLIFFQFLQLKRIQSGYNLAVAAYTRAPKYIFAVNRLFMIRKRSNKILPFTVLGGRRVHFFPSVINTS